MIGFIGEKCWLIAKIPIFWWFWARNVAIYHPTLVMNHKNPIFCYFSNISIHIALFKRNICVVCFYCGEILIKYQNTYILTILAPKCDILPSYPAHESQKIIIFCYFSNSSIYIVLLKGNIFVVWLVLLGKNVH